MPSIFIWKAPKPISASTTIQYYSGANWFLEEHSSYSKSAIYLHQQALSNNGWMFDIKWMPHNWVGSHLLENKSLPYSLVKEDHYARLEQLGVWMRATILQDIPYESCEAEWITIQKWAVIQQNAPVQQNAPYSKGTYHNLQTHVNGKYDEPCLINLSIGSYTNTGYSHQISNKPYRYHKNTFCKRVK